MEAGVHLGERFVSHAEILARAARVSTGLDKLGVGRGDSVALVLRNDFSYLEASMGARTLGAMPVPLNWHLSGGEAGYIIRDSESKALVIHEDLVSGLLGHIPEDLPLIVVPTPPEIGEAYNVSSTNEDGAANRYEWEPWLASHEPWTIPSTVETASVIYTSGTTGRPKGVQREPATMEQYQETLKVVGGVLGVAPGARTVIPAPLYHSAPNAYAIYSLQLGASMVLMPRFDPEELLRLIEKHKITRLQMVPTMFVRLLKLPQEVRDRYDVSSLEYVIHAAAPCPAEVKRAMIEWWGPVISEYYGSTELGAITLCNSEDALKYPGTVGKAIPEATVKILDDDENELGPNEVGTIYARLHSTTDFTYKGDDEKRRKIERGGLITSGDVGYFNDEGYLFLCDRAHDMVISGGVNIYPAEIEGVLIQMEGVRDCAVFGVPNDELGEVLTAVVELQEDSELTEESVLDFLRDRISKYKLPRTVHFRSELPREDSGKLFKRKLRDEFWEQAGRKI